MKALRPDPYESAWSRRGAAGWFDGAVFGGGVLAGAGALSHRYSVLARYLQRSSLVRGWPLQLPASLADQRVLH